MLERGVGQIQLQGRQAGPQMDPREAGFHRRACGRRQRECTPVVAVRVVADGDPALQLCNVFGREVVGSAVQARQRTVVLPPGDQADDVLGELPLRSRVAVAAKALRAGGPWRRSIVRALPPQREAVDQAGARMIRKGLQPPGEVGKRRAVLRRMHQFLVAHVTKQDAVPESGDLGFRRDPIALVLQGEDAAIPFGVS